MAIDIGDLEKQLNIGAKEKINIEKISPITGGDICEAFKIQCHTKSYFLKTHQLSMYGMLKSEAINLYAIANTNTLRVPQAITHGQTDQFSFLLLEYLDLSHSGSHACLGTLLAQLHEHTGNYFGWQQDNWIGATPQPNNKYDEWIAFWRNTRLGYQFNLAKKNHAPRSLLSNCERLLSDFDTLFRVYSPKPSLLHGDLWSGNFGFITDGSPVIYDPASYYGDRESDLAMTELFGGFNQEFYRAYKEYTPVDRGYQVRKDFYNLYHILNHFNLFRGGYAAQAERLCLRVLSEIK